MKIWRTTASVVALSLTIVAAAFAATEQGQAPRKEEKMLNEPVSGAGDFDFFVGHWRVQHRRLKERLAGSHEWIEFEGTSVMQKVMGGYGNMDDNVLESPGGVFRAVTLRAFDPKARQWQIWYLDSRFPQGPLEPPMRGSFAGGVGTFYADDTFNGRPIRVRFLWSRITPTSCRWEQAFSTDNGVTWETNWVMDFERAD
jgi:hypothetical protein